MNTTLKNKAQVWAERLYALAQGKEETAKWRKVRIFSLKRGDRIRLDNVIYVVRNIESNYGTVKMSVGLKGKIYQLEAEFSRLIEKDCTDNP